MTIRNWSIPAVVLRREAAPHDSLCEATVRRVAHHINQRVCIFLIAIAAIGWAIPVRAASVFTIDPTQTTITATGNFDGITLEEQLPGSLSTNFNGNLLVDLTSPGFLDFAHSSMSAIAKPGPFDPFQLPGNFSTSVPSVGKATFRNVVADIDPSNISRPIDGLGKFDASQIYLSFSGEYDFMFPSGDTGAQLAFVGSRETPGAIGTFSILGAVRQITLPINFQFDFLTVVGTAHLTMTGQIVATHQIPEPETVLLAAIGGIAVLLVAGRARLAKCPR